MSNQTSNKNRKTRNYKRGKNVKDKRGKEMEINVPDSEINRADLKGAKNDPSWYSHYPTFLKSVTGINYGNALGSQLTLRGTRSWNNNSGTPVQATAAIGTNAVPGIMSVGFIPTVGAAGDVYDSIANKISVQLYAAMRMKLGSTASYDPTDVMMYVGAMDSAYLLYALGVQIYGALRLASPFNYYYLKGLANAINADFNDFEKNIENFRAFINRFAIYISSLQVPADFDIFKRHVWLLTNIFTDANSAKAQQYVYRLDGYYTYNETVQDLGAYLKFNPITTLWTYSSYITACNTVMEALLGSSDITQMSADINKAFEGNTFVLSAIPEDYLTPVSYSAEVLSQIENAMLAGEYQWTKLSNLGYSYNEALYTWDIFQDNSLSLTNPLVRQYPRFLVGDATTDQLKANYLSVLDSTPIVNFHKSDITEADTIVATRGMFAYINYGFGANGVGLNWGPVYYGTEIYTKARIITIGPNGPFGSLMTKNVYYINLQKDDETQDNELISMLWSVFDWAPTIYLTSEAGTNYYRLQDTDMYAVIGRDQMRDMHTAAVLSEFYSSRFPQIRE